MIGSRTARATAPLLVTCHLHLLHCLHRRSGLPAQATPLKSSPYLYRQSYNDVQKKLTCWLFHVSCSGPESRSIVLDAFTGQCRAFCANATVVHK